ncbi:MAG: hypothetical protein AAFX54_15845 [Pseudomonadota bacterium]
MFANRKRSRELETAFKELSGPNTKAKKTLQNVINFKAKKKPVILNIDNDQVFILVSLIAEYEELYRHYDNQKYHFAMVLVPVVAGLSYAPFFARRLLDVDANDFQVLLFLSSVSIMFLGLVGAWASDHLRQRMKWMHKRSTLLKEKLDSDSQLAILDAEKKARDGADDEMAKEFKGLVLTRGALWEAIPIVSILYALFFLWVGLDLSMGSLNDNSLNLVLPQAYDSDLLKIAKMVVLPFSAAFFLIQSYSTSRALLHRFLRFAQRRSQARRAKSS